jgi:hypothetical protein
MYCMSIITFLILSDYPNKRPDGTVNERCNANLRKYESHNESSGSATDSHGI